ncbi:hypothetical protein N7466_007700 [Penicillium verhagenii]|uniref:uncharacterized protein n=1 Tax=Penicillium verhagenii TaxID=1562060 RepID=UPI0025451D0A|nr:uncharacterized protein N7466_007700 [Penicillium verhagenii]KAJ5928744.1 hypothetical protein N7466_007700 [Penicillium verhagenii]
MHVEGAPDFITLEVKEDTAASMLAVYEDLQPKLELPRHKLLGMFTATTASSVPVTLPIVRLGCHVVLKEQMIPTSENTN